ncbi:MAG: hypothetical protein UD936_11495 [Acutalibacteraceae bacterium]|nr:hypothetical protein [Acutalibacteraceae bacterium]
MGFLDSLFKSTVKSTVRRVVNNVVDNAVDKAFNNNTTTNTHNNQQPAYQPPQAQQIRYGSPITLAQPNITIPHERFTYTISPCIITNEDDLDFDNVDVEFLKSANLFEKDCGAAEIALSFMVAESEDEAFNDNLFDVLPHIYIGNDLFYDDPGKKNRITNAIFTKIENHPCIHEKQEFDLQYPGFKNGQPQTLHYVIYNFYASVADKSANRSTSIALEIPTDATPQRRLNATQALELFATSFTLKK